MDIESRQALALHDLSRNPDHLRGSRFAPPVRGIDQKEISCPRCGKDTKMVKKRSGRNLKEIVDYCPSCGGIWLDAGEYNRISKRSHFEDTLEHFIDFFRLHFPHLFKETME